MKLRDRLFIVLTVFSGLGTAALIAAVLFSD
jgi:hypothetical protein